MPRKQNGFGNFAGSGVKKVNSNFARGQGTRSFGSYPGDRSFGATVVRTVTEQYDLDSTWARWRRGMEYYFQGAWLRLLTDNPNFDNALPDQRDPEEPNYNPKYIPQALNSILYQGTDYEIPITFDGYKFATKNADSRTHYALRRIIDQNRQLGFITEVQADPIAYPKQYLANEIFLKVIADRTLTSDEMLVRSQGERITDGRTAANITEVLTTERRPAIYKGKSPREGSTVTVSIPLDGIRESDFIKENNDDLQSLVGETVYMPNFYTVRSLSLFDVFEDFDNFWTVDVADFIGGVDLQILDNTTNLPPNLNDIQNMKKIYETSKAVGSLKGDFIFKKNQYQHRWGNQYLTAELVRESVDTITYSILPFTIASIIVDETSNLLAITSENFQASCELLTPTSTERWVVCSSLGFTEQYPDYNEDGEYMHLQETPDKDGNINEWQTINLDVDPWQDEIFTNGSALVFADLYTCSCPAYLHAIIRSPETMGEDGKLNRQQRAPLPTAQSPDTYDQAGVLAASSIAQSWATIGYRRSYKICKHTVAAMYINKIRVQEPNTFPSSETREKFEEKLARDISEVAEEFTAQLKRSEITTVEIVYALADALNLDDVELGYVLLTSKF